MSEQTSTNPLDERYQLERGRIFLSGRQALVRLPIEQRRLDRARGWNTAGFISGYRGSPLGSYDIELWKAAHILRQHDIVFQPGLNEDLAATAVWGTQQLGFLPGRKVEGVFSIWYGKGPGVDRSGDPLKHANLQGTEPKGGVLVVFGDDHAGKSSSTAHQSDLALAANDIPVLYPASVSEILTYGLVGIALSRFSGLIVALKLVNETADSTAVIEIRGPPQFVEPEAVAPVGGVHARKEFLAVQEQDVRLARYKLPRAQVFAQANALDRITFGAMRPTFAVVTAGKTYPDVLRALELLGIDAATATHLGLGVYKVGMIYPLAESGVRALATTASELFFVEEKRAHMETQAARILIDLPRPPRISGKSRPGGARLLPADVPLSPSIIAEALADRLRTAVPGWQAPGPGLGKEVTAERTPGARGGAAAERAVLRHPAFCAGCPHNTSTVVPEGSFGMTGIGCHAMAGYFDERRPLPVTHMGGEGATWIGIAPFTDTPHVFQNLGDGTYTHSGSMAIRAAVQAGVNITYKILYNNAVAMTGGQDVEGHPTVARVASQLLAEGVGKVIVVSDDDARFHGAEALPRGVRVYSRDRLDKVQRELRAIVGVTALIYDQTCALQKRRRRKRGDDKGARQRVFINHLVCEGCGDCSEQSSCVAVQPRETDLGRKRAIDQSACNHDLSCVKGFCPSFVTIEGASLKTHSLELPRVWREGLPDPKPQPLAQRVDILVAGIGGTGVITISAILGMAAHLDGHGANLYDMTGLSQKGGAVLSHVRLSPQPSEVLTARLETGEADLVLACDALAATQTDALHAFAGSSARVLVNSSVVAPLAFQRNPDSQIDFDGLLAALRGAARERSPEILPAGALALKCLGDSTATNMIMLGFAWQRGYVPLSRSAIERSINLNNVAVQRMLEAFALGRIAAHRPEELLRRLETAVDTPAESEDLDAFIARRAADLAAYWNSGYACAYSDLLTDIRVRERSVIQGANKLSWAVARCAYKLMAYKDEYEVARLYTDGRFHTDLERCFEKGYRLKLHLAPPWLPLRSTPGGRRQKWTFGLWVWPLLRILSRLKGLRETPFDVFGRTAERRLERQLRDEYLSFVRTVSSQLSRADYDGAVRLAEAPLRVRGFGIVKEAASLEVRGLLRSYMVHTESPR